MPFNLIMGRKLFTVVNDLCDKYEEKFGEKVATASVVNVLIAEALIHRGLIPKDYIRQKYGCDNPIDMGFTANARKEKPPHVIEQEQQKLRQTEKTLKGAYEQWDSLTETAKAYHLRTALQHQDLPVSKQLLKREGILNEQL